MNTTATNGTMNTTATNRKIRSLLIDLDSGALVPRPWFQRRLVWSNKHRVELLRTVLLGYPFPEIYICAGDVDTLTGAAHEFLVDGQQRISTLFQYFKAAAELKLPKDLPPYADLDEESKKDFLQYEVVVRDLGMQDKATVVEVYRRINSTNYPLNAMEINHALFNGKMAHLAEELADDPFFEKHHVFSVADGRRMVDVRFALTLIVTLMSTYFHRDDELESFLEVYNDTFSEERQLRAELREVMSLVEKFGLPPESRAWQKSDLLTLLVETHRAIYRLKISLDPVTVGHRLESFYARAASDGTAGLRPFSMYYGSTIEGTNDRSARVIRGDIIQSVINGDLALDES